MRNIEKKNQSIDKKRVGSRASMLHPLFTARAISTKVLDYYFKSLISVYKPKNISLSIAKQITQR